MERDFALEIKAVTEQGTFSGIASTYGNVDEGGDAIAPGAFTNSLQKRGTQRPLLWSHDMSNPVGLVDLTDSAQGLLVAGSLDLDTTVGKDAYSRLKKGIVKGLSIGYRTIADAMVQTTRLLKEIDLYEVSLVVVPMNAKARVTAVKSGIGTIRDFEAFLHQAGWSKSESTRLAGHGWKGLALPEPDPVEAELLAWLTQQNRAA